MDKRGIKALSNFGDAIDKLVEELKTQSNQKEEKTSSIFSGLFGKNQMGKQLKKIEKGIKEIKSDTTKIIKNQEKLQKLSEQKKKEDNGGLFGSSSKTDSKQIGKIQEGVGTIILIAAAVLAIGMAFKIINPVDVISVIALSAAITMLGLTISKIKENGVPSPMESAEIGLSLLLFTMSVVLSSVLISYIPEISGAQFLTFLGIGAVFGLMFMMGFNKVIEATRKVNIKDVLLLPVILMGISLSIMLSSFFLSKIEPVNFMLLLNIAVMGMALGVVTLAFMIPLYVLGKMGSSVVQGAIISVLVIPLITLAIMLSSYLLNKMEVVDNSKLKGVLMTGLVLAAVTLAMLIPIVALGLLVTSGIGAVAIGLGAAAMLVVVGTMALSSHILATGNYVNGPSKDWAMGISLALLSFVPALVALGTILTIPIVGALIIAGGLGVMLTLAETIVEVDKILSTGKYIGGPSEEWSKGIGLAIGAFAPVFDTLSKANIFSILGGSGMSGEQYAQTMVSIGTSILDVGNLFSDPKNKGTWGNYPSEEWSKGVGLAIGAFAPVFVNLNSSIGGILDSLFGDDDTADKMKNAMVSIAQGIVLVSQELDGTDLKQTKIDPKWASSVSDLISGFSEAYSYIIYRKMSKDKIDKAKPVLMSIASSIKPINEMLGGLSSIGEFKIDLVKLAEGVDAMADAIENLSDSLDSLSESKVTNFRSLTGSLLGLSIIDAEKMTEVITALDESKGKITTLMKVGDETMMEGITDTVKSIWSSVKSDNSGDGTGKSVDLNTTQSVTDQKSKELEIKLDQMVALLTQISSNSSTISSQLNDLGDNSEPKLDH